MNFRVERGRTREDARAHYAAKLRDLYRCAYIDAGAALVCAADRIASAFRVDDMSPEEKRAWGVETMVVDVPLFEMLGMWKLYQDMADLALVLKDEDQYAHYESYIDDYYARHFPAFEEISARLHATLEREGFQETWIRMHEITPGTLYRRMEKTRLRGRQADPSNIGNLRVDVMVSDLDACYRALGWIHYLWPPSSSSRLQDEIAAPRYNGYRALTTRVNCDVNGQSVEFRITTPHIDKVNANGVTAGEPVRGAWWSDATMSERIGIRHTKGLDDNICAFTPSGEVIYPLRRGSTLVDFAFKLHSKLAPHSCKFYVNGKPQPFDYKIRHRDMISVEYDLAYESMTPDWAEAAHTRTARTNIKRHQRNQVVGIHPGRKLIEAVLEREVEVYKRSFSPDKVEKLLSQAMRHHHETSLAVFYARVANGDIAPDEVVAWMIESDLQKYIRILDESVYMPSQAIRFARSWMQQPKARRYQRECRIYPGVEIVGKLVSVDPPRLVVHRADSPIAPQGAAAVALDWGHDEDADREALQVVVSSTRQRGVVWAVMNEVNKAAKETGDADLITHRFHAEIQNDILRIEMTLNIATERYTVQLERQLEALKRNNIIRSYTIWNLFPGERMLLAGLSNRRNRNPFHVRHVKTEEMFFGRRYEIQTIVDYIQQKTPFIIIHGHKRIGKTSLMHHLTDCVLPVICPDVVPIAMNAQDAAPITTLSFVETMLQAAENVVDSLLRRPADRRALREIADGVERDPLGMIVEWVKTAEQMLGGRRLYFMVDEFTATHEAHVNGDLEYGFFQRMDAILDTGRISMLLCIHDHVLRDMETRMTNMNQRSELVPIRELDESAARALIREPLYPTYTFEEGVEDRVIELTNCHPYFIHILCSELVQIVQQSATTEITSEALRFAVVNVLDSAFHYFASYTGMTDTLGLDTLATIARLCDRDNSRWTTIDAVCQAMTRETTTIDPRDVRHRIGQIYAAGIIIKRLSSGQDAQYKIPIGLIHIWLLDGTHQLPPRLESQSQKVRHSIS